MSKHWTWKERYKGHSTILLPKIFVEMHVYEPKMALLGEAFYCMLSSMNRHTVSWLHSFKLIQSISWYVTSSDMRSLWRVDDPSICLANNFEVKQCWTSIGSINRLSKLFRKLWKWHLVQWVNLSPRLVLSWTEPCQHHLDVFRT